METHIETNPLAITTAIAYMNGPPHIGHVYEIILADFLARFVSINRQTELLTGSDEHGKKIQDTARSQGISPIELCDKNSSIFKDLYKRLQINYRRFIRTTDEDHVRFVKESIKRAEQFISVSVYEGYYNVREETFVSGIEAQKSNYCDPVTGIAYERCREETYIFRLSHFATYIRDNLNKVKHFNTSTFLDKLEELEDLSITRIKKSEFNWGIDFPFDDNHIVYVWFDALLNYITGCESIFGNTPYDVIHVIGKDIVWFHSVIYPAILSAIHKPIYNEIYVHGFVTDKNGIKMSKSIGNVVEPDYLLSKYPIEAVRFYFFMETNGGNDIKFNEDSLVTYYNNILINTFGNLFQRYYKLISDVPELHNTRFILSTDISRIISSLDIPTIRNTLQCILSNANNILTSEQPWKMESDKKKECLRKIGALVTYSMIILSCIIPEKINQLNSILGVFEGGNYTFTKGYIAFQRI